MVPPGGFLRGEQFERERVVPPLSRLLCFLSCRSKKGRPCWQALAESRLEKRLKGYNRVTITTSKYHPISETQLRPPLAPSDTANAVPAPSRRELWAFAFPHWTFASWKVPAVIPQAKIKDFCQLPLTREPLGTVSIPGIKNPAASWGSCGVLFTFGRVCRCRAGSTGPFRR